MGTRPVFHPKIGDFFTGLRESKGWTQRQAEHIAKRKRLTALTRQVLWRLEKGKTKNIEPEKLRQLAVLYGVPYEQLLERFIPQRYGIARGSSEEHVTSAPQQMDWLASELVIAEARDSLLAHLDAMRSVIEELAERVRAFGAWQSAPRSNVVPRETTGKSSGTRRRRT